MPRTTHLKSLQALELAIRSGSLKEAAARLGITPAAVGQRIRALENYVGTELLQRGRFLLRPTSELEPALVDLQNAFALLDRVTETLDLQRVSEIQITADPDWAEFWLMPRLAAFREAHPTILFCINGAGDFRPKTGAPEVRVTFGGGRGEPLFTDLLVPFSGPDNLRLFLERGDPTQSMEGMPLLHLKDQLEDANRPGWADWFERFGHRESGVTRGVRYEDTGLALEAVRRDVGFLLCGLSLVQCDLDEGLILNLFPMSKHIISPHPYRLTLRQGVEKRPQVQRFIAWLRQEAAETRQRIDHVSTPG
jgi:LysR family transcriptional regulator, glycine cleavage system transcriptional activator